MPSDGVTRQLERLTARAEHVVQVEDLRERLEGGRTLRVKLGLDPTAGDVTLGWAVPLRKLRQFQDDGHTVVLIIGDFTARIGDPSGRSETRRQLSAEEVGSYAEACVEQLLDILSEENLEIRYNSEWLEPMDLPDVLGLTSRYTVAQMLERDDFSKRFKGNHPISLIEFLYPLLQGYDSVAVEADVELGGTDQLFNLLVGRDLQRSFGQEPQIVMTMPLLEGLDGVQKMSQSLGNYVAIREEPNEMFGKLMSLPDTLVGRYARLAAWLPEEDAHSLEIAAAGGGPAAGGAKRSVARAVVANLHDGDAADRAEEAFDRQFKQKGLPEDIPEVALPPESREGSTVSLPAALAAWGMASSRGEARRLLKQGGVKVGGERVEEESIPEEDVLGAVVQVGKRRFVKVVKTR